MIVIIIVVVAVVWLIAAAYRASYSFEDPDLPNWYPRNKD